MKEFLICFGAFAMGMFYASMGIPAAQVGDYAMSSAALIYAAPWGLIVLLTFSEAKAFVEEALEWL